MTATEDTTDITGRVARGAALLDEKLPGWVDRIDLDTLDLENPCRCILGQTWDEDWADDYYMPYDLHAAKLFGDFGDESATEYGFNSFDGDDFPSLTAEWKRVILARRAEALKAGAK